MELRDELSHEGLQVCPAGGRDRETGDFTAFGEVDGTPSPAATTAARRLLQQRVQRSHEPDGQGTYNVPIGQQSGGSPGIHLLHALPGSPQLLSAPVPRTYDPYYGSLRWQTQPGNQERVEHHDEVSNPAGQMSMQAARMAFPDERGTVGQGHGEIHHDPGRVVHVPVAIFMEVRCTDASLRYASTTRRISSSTRIRSNPTIHSPVGIGPRRHAHCTTTPAAVETSRGKISRS